MAWYEWALIGAICAIVAGIVMVRVVRASRRGRGFMALSMRAKLDFGRALLADPAVPLPAKLLLGLAVAYLAMPFDLIPDFIPVVGQLDDAFVVFGAVLMLLALVPRERFDAALDRARRLDEERRVAQAVSVGPPRVE
jgi:uncharacterized membrane protein YkvA (DUF1232 family)